MTSLQKDVENIKNKVFYIDRKVNPYFNVQINNLIKTIYDLDRRIKELENNNTNNSGSNTFLNKSNESETNSQNESLPFNQKKTNKKQSTKKTTNDIRTINIE